MMTDNDGTGQLPVQASPVAVFAVGGLAVLNACEL
jgi:hypothetical protein